MTKTTVPCIESSVDVRNEVEGAATTRDCGGQGSSSATTKLGEGTSVFTALCDTTLEVESVVTRAAD